jgi:ankyrin repeat protein
MLLLHRGADAGAMNPRGTPLHEAAFWAHPDVVALLLRHGAHVCVPKLPFPINPERRLYTYNNTTPHHMSPILQPNKVANRVFTPLVSSILGRSLESMKLLIQVLLRCIVFL